MEPDLLGGPYECQTIDLGHDDEGPVLATLVSRRAERPTGRAVLYLHGFADYFFQAHLADFFVERGWDFYALDLRKCGRSLLPHQTPNFCRELDEYFPELDAAAGIIRDQDGHHTLLVNGHSTGGLLAALWAHARRDAGIVDGLFLNSPFFDLNAPWLARRPLAAAVGQLARRLPYLVVPITLSTVYGQTLHVEHRGEWSYDLSWKPLAGFPVRAGWLAAIRRAQRRVQRGLDISVPVLLASSTRSYRRSAWQESATLADSVLNVADMARWAPALGRHVTLVRFDGGLHDLTLSGPSVRQRVFSELDRWVGAFVAQTPPAAAIPTTAPPDRIPLTPARVARPAPAAPLALGDPDAPHEPDVPNPPLAANARLDPDAPPDSNAPDVQHGRNAQPGSDVP
ncbi:alpha/beta hydrolase [Micromonospora sp. NPDC050397]|uniref:alpha/beta hydrolase n=1 Tax=Micromonospora sp. NPDC050397 TaxID=3364279 RepID=UPI003850F77B